MTAIAPNRMRNIWKDTQAIVSTAQPRTRPAQTQSPKPATKNQAEKEADRWVAEMMFDHYNG